MPSTYGRDFLLKISDGADPEVFTAIGAARSNGMTLDNAAIDATTMEDAGVQTLMSDAGVQTLELSVDGLFKDSASEERLRDIAFSAGSVNMQLCFPNGDVYEASFVIRQYTRTGIHDGLESFSARLQRSGAGVFTPAA